MAVDSHGNLVIAVSGYGVNRSTWARVEVVAATTGTFYGQAMTARHIYTVAGGGITGFSGDGGPAIHESLDFPTVLAVTGTGLLIIDNRRARMISG